MLPTLPLLLLPWYVKAMCQVKYAATQSAIVFKSRGSPLLERLQTSAVNPRSRTRLGEPNWLSLRPRIAMVRHIFAVNSSYQKCTHQNSSGLKSPWKSNPPRNGGRGREFWAEWRTASMKSAKGEGTPIQLRCNCSLSIAFITIHALIIPIRVPCHAVEAI